MKDVIEVIVFGQSGFNWYRLFSTTPSVEQLVAQFEIDFPVDQRLPGHTAMIDLIKLGKARLAKVEVVELNVN